MTAILSRCVSSWQWDCECGRRNIEDGEPMSQADTDHSTMGTLLRACGHKLGRARKMPRQVTCSKCERTQSTKEGVFEL